MTNEEIWKPIQGYEGIYEVSKAKEIVSFVLNKKCANGSNGLGFLNNHNQRNADLNNINKCCEEIAMQAMEWKDKELKNYLDELLVKLNACEKDRTREATVVEIIKGHFFKNVDLI